MCLLKFQSALDFLYFKIFENFFIVAGFSSSTAVADPKQISIGIYATISQVKKGYSDFASCCMLPPTSECPHGGTWTYLIFVIFCTPPHILACKLYARKVRKFARKKMHRDKTAQINIGRTCCLGWHTCCLGWRTWCLLHWDYVFFT